MLTLKFTDPEAGMIPRVVTAVLSAAVLAAVLGSFPCQAVVAGQRTKAKAETATSTAATSADLNRPATDFAGVTPMIDTSHPDLQPPKRDRNSFFDQTIR